MKELGNTLEGKGMEKLLLLDIRSEQCPSLDTGMHTNIGLILGCLRDGLRRLLKLGR